MGIDYVRLNGNLESVYEALLPDGVKGTNDIRGYFAAKVARHEDERREHSRTSHRVYSYASMTSVAGSALGIGLIAAGPVTAPLGVGIALAVPAAAIARMIVEKISTWMRDGEYTQAKNMLYSRATDDVVRAYQNDKQGGFLGRLYSTVIDRVRGHEKMAEKLVDQIDRLQVGALERFGAVTRIVRAHVTPEFADFLQRAPLDIQSNGATLMSRLKGVVNPEILLDEQRVSQDRSPLAIFSPESHPGVMQSQAQGAALIGDVVRRVVQDRAADAPTVTVAPAVTYGWVTAPQEDEGFLKSMGIELGEYNERTEQYLVRMDAQARESFEEVAFNYPASLQTLPAGVVNPSTHVGNVPFSSMSRETLSAYRMSLQFEQGRAEGDKAATIGSALVSADEENQMRVAEARRAIASARPADGARDQPLGLDI